MKLVGPHLLSIQAGTPLQNKLALAQVACEMTSAPVLKVTGAIVARLPPGNGQAEGRWDFNSRNWPRPMPTGSRPGRTCPLPKSNWPRSAS